ncbi:Zinc finger protein RFP, partial [Ophiophagus hannah]
MDMGKISEYLPDAVTCTLCMRVLHDPVTLNCGHNYCHACIQKHWGGAQCNVACPQCQQRFDHVTLTANRQLGNVAWLIKKLQDKGVLKKPNRGLCEAHKQLLTVFCQNDQALLCAECQKSQDHTNHTLASLEGAAQTAKTEAQVFLDLLRIQKAHIRDSFLDMRAEKENLEKMMDRENQKFSSGYKEMYEMVKTVQLDQMMAAKWINEEIEQELGSLVRNHNTVRAFTKGLERKFEEPAYEFLKDIKEVIASQRDHGPPDRPSPPAAVCLQEDRDPRRHPQRAAPRPPGLRHHALHPGGEGVRGGAALLAGGGDLERLRLGLRGDEGLGVQEGAGGRLHRRRHLGACRFRLYLDYEGGTVHFFDGATREPVALLSYAVFLGERIFPFFKLEEPNSQMRIVP